jgi:hypothetical protein
LTLAICLVAVVAMLASALVTLYLGSRGAEAEANRRLNRAADFATALLMADRDRNRSDAAAIASRPTIQQAMQARDTPTLTRQLVGLRQMMRDDLLAIYAADGTLVASDMAFDYRLDEPVGLVRAALGGTTGAATIAFEGQLMIAAAAPIVAGSDVIGAVLAADRVDERYAQRVAGLAELVVVVTVENGLTTTTEPLLGPPLTADQWASLRGRGDLRFRSMAAAQPMKAFARPLLGLDSRPVGALVVGLPESTLAPIEPADMPLYLALGGGVLVSLWLVGGVAAWGLARPTRSAPARATVRPVAQPAALADPAAGNGAIAPLSDTPASVRQLPGLLIDHGRRLVEANGHAVTLTPTEFDLLWLLAAEPGQVVSRETLLEQLRGADWQAEPGLLDSHVSNLRRKIEPDPSRPRYVLTVRGVGYKLVEAEAQDA